MENHNQSIRSKVTLLTLQTQVSLLKEQTRTLQRELESCQLREKQIIILLKAINEEKDIQTIKHWMNELINQNTSRKKIEQSTDLLTEILRSNL